jgi:DNA-binding Lrp family transcriptional regulator
VNLLKTLSHNCSLPVTRIAKNARVSRDVAVYRLSCLKKQNTILKYGTIVDFAKIGLNYGRLGITLVNNNRIEHEAVAQTLLSKKNVAWAASVQGKYDFIVTVLYSTIQELNAVVSILRKAHGHNISGIHVSILHRLYVCGNNFFHKSSLIEPVKIDYAVPLVLIDELDKRIIGKLRENSKFRITDICSELQISPQTFIARKKALEKKKIILKYLVVLNRESFCLNSYHVFWNFTHVSEFDVRTFRNYILSMREIEYVSEAMGSSDFECYLSAQDERQLYSLINSIRDRFPTLIRSVEHLLILKEHKQF